MIKPTMMNTPEQHRFELFVLIFVLALVFIMAARTPLDSDMWWHLRAGEQTWISGKPMLFDNLSFTRFGEKWINHSWLSQVGFYLAFKIGGFFALEALVALVATTSMWFVYKQMQASPLINAFALILGATVASVVWSPRPQLVSLLFVAITGYVLQRFRSGRTKIIWALLPLFVLWSNLHGGYPLGLMLIGSSFLGELLNKLPAYKQETLKWKTIFVLLGVGVLSVAMVVINPNGINMLRIPFQTVGVDTLRSFISEWASPDFHQVFQQPMLWLLLSLLAVIGISGKRIDFVDLINISLFAYLAFLARRNFGPFAIVASPLLANYAWQACQSIRLPFGILSRQQEYNLPDSSGLALQKSQAKVSLRILNIFLVSLIFFSGIVKLYITSYPTFVAAHISQEYPVGAISWLRENPSRGNMLSEYRWGGYLTWNLPEYPVFIDGRTDLYGDEIISNWMIVVQGSEDWDDILTSSNIHLVLLESGRPVLKLLKENGWHLLYQDKGSILYGK